jgi:hypothetical protein
MSSPKTFAIFACLSLFAAGTAMAGRISNDATGAKGDGAPVTSAIDQTSHEEGPVVWGRSVSIHHKTRMHHVKMKPEDLAPVVTEIPQPND